jgi:sugar/nucleoside kinase (ribokinase family)
VFTGIEVHRLPSPVSTTFVNIYLEGRRTQYVEAVAEPITPADLPKPWARAPIVLLGPVAGEVPVEWATTFPGALVGVSAQGWMRTWDATGRVIPAIWQDRTPFLQRADVLFLSKEDVGGDERYLEALASEVRLMVVTDGWRGATLYQGDMRLHVPPRPVVEVDPTGAGDVFAAAFLVRLAECGDPFTAARFANIVASFSVAAPGWDGIPMREQVDAWLASETTPIGSNSGFPPLPVGPAAG